MASSRAGRGCRGRARACSDLRRPGRRAAPVPARRAPAGRGSRACSGDRAPQRAMPTSRSTRTPAWLPAAVIAADRSAMFPASSTAMTRSACRASAAAAEILSGPMTSLATRMLAHPGGGHGGRFPDGRDGDADGSGPDLQQRDVRALLHLGVRPQARGLALQRRHHGRDVAGQQAQVDDQRGGRQRVRRGARVVAVHLLHPVAGQEPGRPPVSHREPPAARCRMDSGSASRSLRYW